MTTESPAIAPFCFVVVAWWVLEPCKIKASDFWLSLAVIIRDQNHSSHSCIPELREPFIIYRGNTHCHLHTPFCWAGKGNSTLLCRLKGERKVSPRSQFGVGGKRLRRIKGGIVLQNERMNIMRKSSEIIFIIRKRMLQFKCNNDEKEKR